MKRLFSFMAAAVTAACVFCLSASAFAADTFTLNIQPTIQEAIGFLFAALSGLAIGLVGWLLDPTKGKLAKLQIDDITRGYIETAIRAGLRYAENRVRQLGGDIKNPVTEKQLIAIAVNYVLPRIPDALNHFDIDATDLEAMIIARFCPPIEVSDAGVSQ